MWWIRFVAVGAVLAGVLAPVAPASANPSLQREIERLSGRVDASPSDVDLRLLRADLLRRAKRWDEALADLRTAEHLSPSDARVHVAAGETFLDAGRSDDAVRRLEAFAASDPTGRAAFRGHWLLGRIYAERGEVAAALASYHAATDHGDDVQLHLELGFMLSHHGRVDEAIDAYAAGVQALGGGPALQVELVELLLTRDRAEEALPHVESLLEHARADARWLVLRARVHEAAGRVDRARADRVAALAEAERVLERRRRAPLALLERARALMALGRIAQARTDLEEVVRRAPGLKEGRVMLHAARAGGVR